MKAYIETYGCTLNQADSDIIKAILMSHGIGICDSEKDADIIVLNTCTVKGSTENKILHRIGELKGKRLIVAGCLSVNEGKIRSIAPNAVVIWPEALRSFGSAIDDAISGRSTTHKKFEYKDGLPRIFTAPILRIPLQDGCTGNCFFCQTKIARPGLMSYSRKTIVKWIKQGVSKGAKEIQLTGMDTGAYGLDIGTNLCSLVSDIISLEGDFRIRIGMLNPNHAKRMLSPLIDLFSYEKMYKFIHIPVQTGSEKVCSLMNRPHTVSDFWEIADALRSSHKEITIGTDIIVGYPGETESDFEETIELVKSLKPGMLNISKFTPRQGTKAKEMKQLDSALIKRRSSELTELYNKISEQENMKLVGRRFRVLTTERLKGTVGRTDNYRQIVLDSDAPLGSFVDVEVFRASKTSVFGKVVDCHCGCNKKCACQVEI